HDADVVPERDRARLVGLRFPWMVARIDEFRLAPASMPMFSVPEITFRAAGVVPPAVKVSPPLCTNMLIPDPPPSAIVPVASVPMKLPSITASLPDSRSMCEELQRLITRPRMVTVPGLEALDTTTQSIELEP